MPWLRQPLGFESSPPEILLYICCRERRRLHRKILLALLVSAKKLSCACNAQQPSRPLKLASGRVVKILGEGPINFSQGPPALMLKYETDLQVADAEKLRNGRGGGVLLLLQLRGGFLSGCCRLAEEPY